MEILFNYRPDGKLITTNAGEKLVMAIRRGPRGLVAVIKEEGPVVIWDNESATAHEGDSEEILTSKLIEVLNA